MISYIFCSDELKKRSLTLTVFVLYSSLVVISLSQFVSLVGAEAQSHERLLLKRDFGQPESHRIHKREITQITTNSASTKIPSAVAIIPTKVTPSGSALATHATLGVATVTSTEKSLDQNCSLEVNANKTECTHLENNGNENSFIKQMTDNKEMLLRTLYVSLGVTGVIVVYFVGRAIWLRQKRTKSRKYRIIAQNGDQRDLEMEPLGDGKDDDDEDYTVFELNGRKK